MFGSSVCWGITGCLKTVRELILIPCITQVIALSLLLSVCLLKRVSDLTIFWHLHIWFVLPAQIIPLPVRYSGSPVPERDVQRSVQLGEGVVQGAQPRPVVFYPEVLAQLKPWHNKRIKYAGSKGLHWWETSLHPSLDAIRFHPTSRFPTFYHVKFLDFYLTFS